MLCPRGISRRFMHAPWLLGHSIVNLPQAILGVARGLSLHLRLPCYTVGRWVPDPVILFRTARCGCPTHANTGQGNYSAGVSGCLSTLFDRDKHGGILSFGNVIAPHNTVARVHRQAARRFPIRKRVQWRCTAGGAPTVLSVKLSIHVFISFDACGFCA